MYFSKLEVHAYLFKKSANFFRCFLEDEKEEALLLMCDGIQMFITVLDESWMCSIKLLEIEETV